MIFGLLLSHLPHVNEARPHYEALLSLEPVRRRSVKSGLKNPLKSLWRRIKSRLS
ncbi:hypothetical protein [Paraburkholderia unamae]|uniref:Uncharacterized protein n=1 Tax=Paraburkholderia unamae TaxID=219649 RepID=A0ABX5KDK3_9BURK|nr:hypothetical protein [Paraburkholderia unamae]PVX75101.1 hypothetical protein C7402_11833 [Paraburkholderia unamae]